MDTENRFAHLLRPIRDLSENWNIDIAKYLEDYIQEIEGITVSFDNGANIMNFAEAALVIQGSACVYSKKVEYLYKLVYQTLNMISSKKKEGVTSSVDAQGRDVDVSASLGQNDTQQFLTLDDIKESKNIDMVEYAGKEHNISLIQRTPLALIPLQDAEKCGSTLKSHTGELLGSKQDYKMNTSSIHSSGALLLESINRIYSDGKPVLSGQRPPIPPLHLDTPTVAVAHDVMEMDDGGADMDVDGGYYYDNDNTTPKSIRQSSRKGGFRIMQDDTNIVQDDEPLLLLDPHQASSSPNRPFQKGNTIKVPASLRGKGNKSEMKKATQLEPLAEFLLHTFYSCCMQFPRQLMKKPLYPEFETQYWEHQRHVKEIRKKEAQKLKSLQKENVAVQLQNAVEGVGLEEEEGLGEPCIPLGDMPDYDDDDNVAAEGYYDNNVDEERINEAIGSHDPAMEYQSPAKIAESLNIVQSYEDIVRNYVEKTLESAMTYAVETELSSRVRQWERRIRPILEEEELRPPFDIHKYGGEILNEFDKHEIAEDDHMGFKTIAQDKDVHEVCRMFLASLQLANNYNIKIDKKDDEQVMWMKLLSRQLPHEAMEEFRAPSLQTAHSTS